MQHVSGRGSKLIKEVFWIDKFQKCSKRTFILFLLAFHFCSYSIGFCKFSPFKLFIENFSILFLCSLFLLFCTKICLYHFWITMIFPLKCDVRAIKNGGISYVSLRNMTALLPMSLDYSMRCISSLFFTSRAKIGMNFWANYLRC